VGFGVDRLTPATLARVAHRVKEPKDRSLCTRCPIPDRIFTNDPYSLLTNAAHPPKTNAASNGANPKKRLLIKWPLDCDVLVVHPI